MKNNAEKIVKNQNNDENGVLDSNSSDSYLCDLKPDSKKNDRENSYNSGLKNERNKIDKSDDISYTQELLRKSIHLCSLSIPILYIFVTQKTALSILIPMALFTITLDLLTRKFTIFGNIYEKTFGKMLRKHEKKSKRILLNGASWVLISAVLMVFVFPKILAVTGFTILIISDICAALIGRKFGRTPLFNKSWEGTGAFICSAIIVVTVYYLVFSAPWTYFMFGCIGAIVAAFAEASSKVLKLDDNLSIPISFGIIAWLGGLIAANMGIPFLNII